MNKEKFRFTDTKTTQPTTKKAIAKYQDLEMFQLQV
jgi:hypothetical protein